MKKLLFFIVPSVFMIMIFPSCCTPPTKGDVKGTDAFSGYAHGPVGIPTKTTDFSPIINYITKYNSGTHSAFATSYVLPLNITNFLVKNDCNIKIINALNTSNGNSPIFIIVPTDADNNTIWDGKIQYQAADGPHPFPVYCNLLAADVVNQKQLKPASFNAADVIELPINEQTAKQYIEAYNKKAIPRTKDVPSGYSDTSFSVSVCIDRNNLLTNNNYPYLRVFNGLQSDPTTGAGIRILIITGTAPTPTPNPGPTPSPGVTPAPNPSPGVAPAINIITTTGQLSTRGLCPTNCDTY